MDIKRTYSRADLARELGRPRSTVSYWIEMFTQYLPSVGSGRNKRYKEEALINLRIIEQMKDKGEPNEMVEEILRENTSEITYEQPKDNNSFFADIAESYRALYEEMMNIEMTNEQQHNETKEQLNEMKKALEESQRQNRELATSLEEVKKLLEEKPKGFFQKLFGG
ncbi:hypothetical protein CN367_11755 [Priestia megaterium]|uniref:MerR family transcriptional regulator n=1 Tax=Priestia megaterium TaxID=1404 RepID=UPI000BF55D71|nr:MerR family transcriptional regulator [Priestia megaterium]PEZ47035.1 hypothetical protein CN367_11755 [Priestia megaterium]